MEASPARRGRSWPLALALSALLGLGGWWALRSRPALEPAPMPPHGALTLGEEQLLSWLETRSPEALRRALEHFNEVESEDLQRLYRAWCLERLGEPPPQVSAALAGSGIDAAVYAWFFRGGAGTGAPGGAPDEGSSDREGLREIIEAMRTLRCNLQLEQIQGVLEHHQAQGHALPERLSELPPQPPADPSRPLPTRCPSDGEIAFRTPSGQLQALRCSKHPDRIFDGHSWDHPEQARSQIALNYLHARRGRLPGLLIEAAGIQAGQRVADIGCGVGLFTLPLARQVGPGGEVYAVDVNASVLDLVAFSSARRGLGNVSTIRCTPADPALPAASVDVALLNFAFHTLTFDMKWGEPGNERFQAYLLRLRQALRPGGRLVVFDKRPHGPGPSLFRTPEAIEALLRGGGFTRRRLIDLPGDGTEERMFFLILQADPPGPRPGGARAG